MTQLKDQKCWCDIEPFCAIKSFPGISWRFYQKVVNNCMLWTYHKHAIWFSQIWALRVCYADTAFAQGQIRLCILGEWDSPLPEKWPAASWISNFHSVCSANVYVFKHTHYHLPVLPSCVAMVTAEPLLWWETLGQTLLLFPLLAISLWLQGIQPFAESGPSWSFLYHSLKQTNVFPFC